ncbi:hypothetical protein BCR44DRAFT_283025 [Catenaria anguillulae PL171]|uniref:Uncharacterized protein n=1 Tax=Catenaria anguillulae PL171 TaxID=765915 RepID=A0A1Y2HDY7_9FUNG|nr:hypothetical protein BCR44DRAFT_283025 [Catenaria anguillulae PL171]
MGTNHPTNNADPGSIVPSRNFLVQPAKINGKDEIVSVNVSSRKLAAWLLTTIISFAIAEWWVLLAMLSRCLSSPRRFSRLLAKLVIMSTI